MLAASLSNRSKNKIALRAQARCVIDNYSMKVNLGIFAFVCLFSPVASYSQSFEGFRCSAFAPIHILGTPARSNSVAEKTIDIVLVCTGGIPTPSGSPLYRKTFDVSLNTPRKPATWRSDPGKFPD
jgi:hypothetical protein